MSGPLLDRIHLRVEVPSVDEKASWDSGGSAESVGAGGYDTASTAARVTAARQRQAARQGGRVNSHLTAAEVARLIGTVVRQSGGARLLEAVQGRPGLSFRGRESLVKVARTIADLAGSDDLREEHLLEALTYRSDELAGRT